MIEAPLWTSIENRSKLPSDNDERGVEQTYFRRGFGLKKEIEPVLAAEYHSGIVEFIRARGYEAVFGVVTVRVAVYLGF